MASLFPDRALTFAPALRLKPASVVGTALILAGIVRAAGRIMPRRPAIHQDRRPGGIDRRVEIAEALARLPAQSVRIVLQTIALRAQSVIGSELAAAGIGGDATHPFTIWTQVGMPPEQVEQVGRPPRHVGLLGLLVDGNRTLRVRDVRQHPDHLGLPRHHPPITSFLAVPIRFRARVAGCLCLSNKQGGAEFTIEDQQMAEMLAVRLGSALETGRVGDGDAGAEAWLQSVLDQMPEGILVIDRRGQVILQNGAFRSMMNAEASEQGSLDPLTIELARPSGERLVPDDLPIVRALTNGEVTIGREFVARGPDDRAVPLLVSAAPVLTQDGSSDGAIMVCQDVSIVHERQRVQAEWTSIVAHELRQPISVIALRSSLLLRGPLSGEQREGIEQISRCVHSLGRMVMDLLDASLLESDRLRVRLARLDLGQLLVDVVRRSPFASPRTRTHIPADVRLFVTGDAQRLDEVIANLLSNAVKYAAPDTEIVVDLRFAAGQAHVRVINVGDPIPEDELPFVFNRFARTRSASASGVKGLGLGLYIARGLVAAHHGRIWAESAGGRTTFHITLPLDGPPVSAVAPGLTASTARPEKELA